MYPEDLRYTAEHEWVRVTESGTVVFGITDYAQDALGDIVYVSLPAVGRGPRRGQACGEVESTKSVSDIYAPVAGEVVARNEALDASPETVNSRPVRRRLDGRGAPGRPVGRRRPAHARRTTAPWSRRPRGCAR